MSQKTTKSRKTIKRDKPKHSDKGRRAVKKQGAGGKGTWGTARDDIRYVDEVHVDDPNDPNFDPTAEKAIFTSKTWYSMEERKKKFKTAYRDLNNFKKSIKEATDEYLASYVEKDFMHVVKELEQPLFHQDIPSIIIKKCLDRKKEDRNKISSLLHSLNKEVIITNNQMIQGFKKVYNSLPDLLLDSPKATITLNEFTKLAVIAGYLDSKSAEEMAKAATLLADGKVLQTVKKKCKEYVKEYYSSNEMADFLKSSQELEHHYHYELVKLLISLSLDRTNKERESASYFLANAAGSVISSDEISKAFSILLGRVEDLMMDVPNVLELLSFFVARAITDEAIPPAFLYRVDLAGNDMGNQVVQQAQMLLKEDRASEKLSRVWIGACKVPLVMRMITRLPHDEKYEVYRQLTAMLDHLERRPRRSSDRVSQSEGAQIPKKEDLKEEKDPKKEDDPKEEKDPKKEDDSKEGDPTPCDLFSRCRTAAIDSGATSTAAIDSGATTSC